MVHKVFCISTLHDLENNKKQAYIHNTIITSLLMVLNFLHAQELLVTGFTAVVLHIMASYYR